MAVTAATAVPSRHRAPSPIPAPPLRESAARLATDTGVRPIADRFPPDGDDCPLWHVVHSDGDEEDLDEAEMSEVRCRPALMMRIACVSDIGLYDMFSPSHLTPLSPPGPYTRAATDWTAACDCRRLAMIIRIIGLIISGGGNPLVMTTTVAGSRLAEEIATL